MPDKLRPHPPGLKDHHWLPTLGGAFAALFEARNLALLPASYTHGHAEQTQKTDSARTKQNKGFQPPLSIYLKQSLECHTCVYTVYSIYAQKHKAPDNQRIQIKFKKTLLQRGNNSRFFSASCSKWSGEASSSPGHRLLMRQFWAPY